MTEAIIREALRHVVDPELGINIIDLGLVYRIEIQDTRVRVVMTMTNRACPLGDYLKALVDSTIRWRLRDVQDVEVVFVWEPPWNPDMMSAQARRELDSGQ